MLPSYFASGLNAARLITEAGRCSAALFGSRWCGTLRDSFEGAQLVKPDSKRWQPLSAGYFAEPVICALQRAQSTPETCSVGIVHSTEALSAVDGPGLRYVVHLGSVTAHSAFLDHGKAFSATSAILQDMQRTLVFLTPNDGGLTCSGADPLLQSAFCEELFKGAHDLGVTTCLHTQPPEEPPMAYEHVLHHTDSVIVQLSTMVNDQHKESLSAFTSALEDMGVPYHIRYLLVPELTDQPADVSSLVNFARSRGPNLQGIQVMPYHLLGGRKWEALGLPPSLRTPKPTRLQDALRMVQHMQHQGISAELAV